MSDWSPDMVRLMRDACEQSDYHERLAAEIDAMLGGLNGLQLCDAGCGLGWLSMALAERSARVTAIDVAQAPLEVLTGALQARGLSNVAVMQQDVWSLPESVRFDAMVFCLFGQFEEALALAKRHCKRLVIVKRSKPARRFALDANSTACDVSDTARRILNASGLRYAERTVTLALDQPFRSMEDALLFFRLYAKRDATTDVDENAVRQRLRPGKSAEFPLLLPASRELTIFVIDL